VGSTSTQTLTLTNAGTASVTVSQGGVTGAGFGLSGLNLPLTLAAGQSASLNVIFAPSAAGSVAGSLSILSSASASPVSVTLSGSGVTYHLTPSASSVGYFGSVGVSAKSVQTIALTNTGTGTVTISQITLSGTAFNLTALILPATLTPGQSVTIAFDPSAPGSAVGTISVISNASVSPLVLSLTGTGATYQLTSSPACLSFGDVAIGQSAILPVTLTSTGSAGVTISKVSETVSGLTVNGPSLPLTLPSGQSTGLGVTFAPTAAGSVTGALDVTKCYRFAAHRRAVWYRHSLRRSHLDGEHIDACLEIRVSLPGKLRFLYCHRHKPSRRHLISGLRRHRRPNVLLHDYRDWRRWRGERLLQRGVRHRSNPLKQTGVSGEWPVRSFALLPPGFGLRSLFRRLATGR